MRDCRLSISVIVCAVVLFSLGLSSAVNAQNRIKLTAKLSEPTDGIANVTVAFKIDEGWHAYEATDVGQVLTVSLELPDDVVAAGRWQKPESVAYREAMIYKGEGRFTRKLAIADSDSVRQVVVKVAYQVCTERGCLAPSEAKFELPIAAASASNASTKKDGFDYSNAYFSAPELLMADGELLNVASKQHYISPAMYDIDNDGALELVTGDVAGKVRVYENESNDADGMPVWADAGFLSSTSGEQTMAKNW